ncbi:MAG: hypothetical protein WAX70_03135, partial [Gemmiger qucibialis]
SKSVSGSVRYLSNIYTAFIIADTWPQKKPRQVKILPAAEIIHFGQYRIILSADTASEVRQMLSQKRR